MNTNKDFRFYWCTENSHSYPLLYNMLEVFDIYNDLIKTKNMVFIFQRHLIPAYALHYFVLAVTFFIK